MRTTLAIDPAVFAAAKAESARTGRSLGDVISAWARRGVEAEQRQGRSKRGGFPVFTQSADSPPITPEAVRDLIEDEGLPPRR